MLVAGTSITMVGVIDASATGTADGPGGASSLCTADVSSALHLLNNNATWKNQSGKLGLTRTLKAANKKYAAIRPRQSLEIGGIVRTVIRKLG